MKLQAHLTNDELWTKTGGFYNDWVHAATVSQASLWGPEMQAVDGNGNTYIRKYGEQYWNFDTIGNAKRIISGGGRTAVITNDRKLMTREAPWVSSWANQNWIFQLYGPVDAALTTKRMATVLDNGELWTKDGDLGGQWVFQLNGAVDVELAGDRIVVLLNNGELWMKEGSPYSAWQFVAASIIGFDADGGRIAAITWDKRLLVKDGPLSNAWMFYVNAATKVALSRDVVAAILDDRSLWTHKPETNWVFQVNAARDVDISHYDLVSWHYGGADHSVNSASEAERFITDLRGSNDELTAQANSIGKLSPEDRAYIERYNDIERGWSTSRAYGGPNWRLDTNAEGDALVGRFLQLDQSSAVALFQRLHPADEEFVAARVEANIDDVSEIADSPDLQWLFTIQAGSAYEPEGTLVPQPSGDREFVQFLPTIALYCLKYCDDAARVASKVVKASKPTNIPKIVPKASDVKYADDFKALRGSRPGRALGTNLTRAKRVPPSSGYDAAHVVAHSHPLAAPARAILQRCGIHPNSAANGYWVKRSIHQTSHTTAYFYNVNALLEGLNAVCLTSGGGIIPSDKEKVERALQAIGKLLNDGKMLR